jgi:acetolactate synthase-1/2/3 large subunit
MRVAADRCFKPSEIEEKLKWLIEHDGPALLEVITDRKVPVLPMVPSGRGLHEFLVYDEGMRIPNLQILETLLTHFHSQGTGAQGADARAQRGLPRSERIGDPLKSP